MKPIDAPPVASRRLTSALISGGVVLSAICFIVAIVAEVLEVEGVAGDMTDLAALLDGLAAMAPWAWASLGTFIIVATPAAGLAVTAYEYAVISDRRTSLTAVAVIVVLAVSATIAILR